MATLMFWSATAFSSVRIARASATSLRAGYCDTVGPQALETGTARGAVQKRMVSETVERCVYDAADAASESRDRWSPQDFRLYKTGAGRS